MRIPASSPSETRAGLKTNVTLHRDDAERAVAREMAELIRAHDAVGRPTVLGLATGQTPVGVYAELVRMHREEDLDFSNVVTFNLDEYVGLGAGHPATFRHFMDESLFDLVNVPKSAIHVPDGDLDAADIPAFCADYEAAIAAAGGIDLQLLGIGRNGHVAFNEPGSGRDSRTRLVELAPGTRADAARFFEGHGATPQHAITMGLATVQEAHRLRVLAFGSHKAEIVRRALVDPVMVDVPATYLRDHDDVTFWLDAEAAAELPQGSD
jgi:glucosamine-6-phosphate deaminase